MVIRLTKHCIEQFINRNFDLQIESEEEVVEIVTKALKKGVITRERPGKAYEAKAFICGEPHYFVIRKTPREIVVITYLGNQAYKNWMNRHEIYPRYAGPKNIRPRFSDVGVMLH